MRLAIKWLIFLLILPYALVVLYAIPFIHPVSTLMILDLATFQGYERRWVGFDDIAPVLVQSVMMSEDGQFCSHYGVDVGELKTVVEDALNGDATRGASTIPMQTVKNLYLFNIRSVVRKALELPLAVTADFIWSKRRMMEIYLNIAEWGDGIYGIEAAAQHYFNVPASKLSASQAAYLAVSLPNPYERIANKPSGRMQSLAARVKRLARQSGSYIKCLYE
ncbi:biosynthetic peptidoglycan transglycosylase [Rhizobium sp. L1K21]|nr:transglycosylase domain-containing protein [Rhizobium sp. L1K21]MCO6188124.1 biosynthetic peptidoglycan transglycosylase [Rhizobium sp. L1K21]